MAHNHEFTGVFIPAHIWLSSELAPAEKMILGEIEALSKRSGWCDASRAHFAYWLGCSERNVNFYLRRLLEKGFIEQEGSIGGRTRRRVIGDRFYNAKQEGGVKNLYPGGEGSFKGGGEGSFKGGVKDLSPEIKDKVNKEIKEESSSSAKPKIETPPASPTTTTTTTPDVENSFSVEDKKPESIIPAAVPVAPVAKPAAAPVAPAPDPEPISPYASPNAHTAQDLKAAMSAYYKANPQYYNDGILNLCKGSQYPPERQIQIVTEWCLFTIGRNGGTKTYHALSADLGKWFLNQPQADTWKQSAKPGQSWQQTNQTYYTPPPRGTEPAPAYVKK